MFGNAERGIQQRHVAANAAAIDGRIELPNPLLARREKVELADNFGSNFDVAAIVFVERLQLLGLVVPLDLGRVFALARFPRLRQQLHDAGQRLTRLQFERCAYGFQ